MRWAHSAVDYLAAAVGGDRVGGAVVQGRGEVGVGMEGEIPIVLGTLEAMECVCLDLLVTGGGRSLAERVRGGQSAPFDHYCMTSVLLGSCHKETR